MQYASALALASLSGKAPSNTSLIQAKTQSVLSSRPLEKTAMLLKSMLSWSQSAIEKLMKYIILNKGHQQRIEQSLCWPSCWRSTCSCCQERGQKRRKEGSSQEGRKKAWTWTWGGRFRNWHLWLIDLNLKLKRIFLLQIFQGWVGVLSLILVIYRNKETFEEF